MGNWWKTKVNSVFETIPSFPHIENITLSASEEIYEVIGRANDLGLDGLVDVDVDGGWWRTCCWSAWAKFWNGVFGRDLSTLKVISLMLVFLINSHEIFKMKLNFRLLLVQGRTLCWKRHATSKRTKELSAKACVKLEPLKSLKNSRS